MIIAFGWTSAALVTGHKSCTRRLWRASYAEQFARRHVGTGALAKAYNRSPRAGGAHIADLLILSVRREPLAAMPDTDYDAEGFRWLAAHPGLVGRGAPFEVSEAGFRAWRASGAVLWTVRFALARVTGLERADGSATAE